MKKFILPFLLTLIITQADAGERYDERARINIKERYQRDFELRLAELRSQEGRVPVTQVETPELIRVKSRFQIDLAATIEKLRKEGGLLNLPVKDIAPLEPTILMGIKERFQADLAHKIEELRAQNGKMSIVLPESPELRSVKKRFQEDLAKVVERLRAQGKKALEDVLAVKVAVREEAVVEWVHAQGKKASENVLPVKEAVRAKDVVESSAEAPAESLVIKTPSKPLERGEASPQKSAPIRPKVVAELAHVRLSMPSLGLGGGKIISSSPKLPSKQRRSSSVVGTSSDSADVSRKSGGLLLEAGDQGQ